MGKTDSRPIQVKIDLGIYPNKETLIDLFITQNKSRKEICDIYHFSESSFKKLIKLYGIKKDRSLSQIHFRKTCQEKYGCNAPMQNSEILNKSKQTNILKYGCNWSSQNEKVKQKMRDTLRSKHQINISIEYLKKYYLDLNHSFQECCAYFQISSYNLHKIIKQYNLKKPVSLVVQSHIALMQEKYGVNNFAQKNIKHADIWIDDEKFVEFLDQNQDKKFNLKTLAEYFNVDSTSIGHKIIDLGLQKYIVYKKGSSYYEDELIQIFKDKFKINNIKKHDRTTLEGQEIDIYLPEYKTGIEFNGDYWHSDIYKNYQDHGGRSTYHQNKSLLAESKGIFLFHIFEHEWINNKLKEKILKRLECILQKNTNKIPARKCIVKEINKNDKNNFLNINHIQGADNHSNYFLGLFYKDQLVSCMTFGHSKYKKYNYDLIRFASLKGYNIQGGASKLFKYFVDNKLKENENVVSYNDITKTKGDIYKILGFKCTNLSAPNYWWINFETKDIRSRYQEQAAGEVERMHAQGYHRVCDCGTRTWVYTKGGEYAKESR